MAGNTTNISIRMDADLKAQADALFTAVSYTHLDVYKRQLLLRAISLSSK